MNKLGILQIMLICIFSALAIQIQMLCSTMPKQINSNPCVLGESPVFYSSNQPNHLLIFCTFLALYNIALERHPVLILWWVTAAWYFKAQRHWPGCYTFRMQTEEPRLEGFERWACSQSFQIQRVAFILSHPMIWPLNNLTELEGWHQMSCLGTSFALRPQTQEAPRCERK